MSKLKNFFFLSLLVIFILETISYFFYKLNLLEISHFPKFYMSKNLIPNYEWWTEEREWGAWHKPNSSTLQKRSCFNVTYESNEIGARDKSFILNSDNDIVLIGDSFAEGYGVNYNDTSQKHLEDLTKLNILNFGVSHNFGPVQYSIIYNKLAKKFKHNKILIYFLPDNDFGENDFNNWRGSKRYRPYYKKINENFYETFIPSNSIKNYTSATKKIKQKFKDYFWTSGLFINIYYQYKLHRSKKKNLKNNFSGYYDAPLSQQKAAIYFINEIVDKSSAEVFLVSIPRPQDFQRFSVESKLNNIFWNNYFTQKSLSNDRFTFIDLINFLPSDLNKIYLQCDGHWSPAGNIWAARIISKHLHK